MAFSVEFTDEIKKGKFACLDDYMLTHSNDKYKTYSDLCSLSFSNSLSSINSIQSAMSILKESIAELLSKPVSFSQINNISNFICLKIIFSQLDELVHSISESDKNLIFVNEEETRALSRQQTKECTTKTISEHDLFAITTPTFSNNNYKDQCVDFLYYKSKSVDEVRTKDLLSAVQWMKEKKMITLEEREKLKENIIGKNETFIKFVGINNNRNELIRNMRRFLKGFD